MHLNPEYMHRAFGAGASGCVVEHAGPDELTSAIRSVAAERDTSAPAPRAALVQSLQLGEAEHPADCARTRPF